MSAKQLARLALIFGALLLLWGGAAVARHRDKTPTSGDAFRIPRLSRSAVDTILLARATDTTLLTRKDTTNWTANGHPAASQAIADLFTAFADTAPGSDLIAERKTSHAALGVDSAGGTRTAGQGRRPDAARSHRRSPVVGFLGRVRATAGSGGDVRVAWPSDRVADAAERRMARPSDRERAQRQRGNHRGLTRNAAVYPAACGNEVGVVTWRIGGFVGGGEPVDGVPHDRREWVRHHPADGFGALLATGPTDPAPPKGRDRTPDAPL